MPNGCHRSSRVRSASPTACTRRRCSSATPTDVNDLDAAIARAVGTPPIEYVRRSGGYTTADRYAVRLADGGRAFVKSSDDPLLAGWLRREHEVYKCVEAPFMPVLLGWDDDGGRATLVL